MTEVIYSKKRLGAIINKLNIDVETDIDFQSIVSMFNDRPEYQIWALKLNKTHHVSLLTIKLIKEWAQNHHQDIHLLEYQDILPYNT